MKLKIPNILTIGRIILVPIFVFTFYLPGLLGDLIPFFIFLLASFTDFLDGLLARLYKEESKLGELLDPIADKLLVILVLSLLLTENKNILFVLPSLIIITREFLVIAIRQRLAELGEKVLIKVMYFSKIKTAFQMISLFLLLYNGTIFALDSYFLGTIFLQVASILTIISFVYYVNKSWSLIVK